VWTYVRETFPSRTCPVPLAHSYATQLLRGLAHLKAKHVVHNDVKLENLLLDGAWDDPCRCIVVYHTTRVPLYRVH
jgi:hypothetical protein